MKKVVSHVLRITLVSVLIFSGFAKLVSINYTADLIVQIIPIDYRSPEMIDLVRFTTILVATFEVIISLLILLVNKPHTYLKILIVMILFFLILNIYQINIGISDCACFGGLIKLKPEVTLIKSAILLLTSITLLKLSNSVETK